MLIDFARDKTLYPFESKWFEGAGPRVHYVDEGTGSPVVMFHGNPTWSFLYRKVIKELSGRFRCIAMEYPGFGLSERPSGSGYTSVEHAQVIGKLVDHLNLDQFIVMGQDWGGPIGMTVALERAERVPGMVFANTWYWPAQGSLATSRPTRTRSRHRKRVVGCRNSHGRSVGPGPCWNALPPPVPSR